MQGNNLHLKQLLDRWLKEDASDADKAALIDQLQNNGDEETITAALQQAWDHTTDEGMYSAAQQQQLINSILSRYPATPETSDETNESRHIVNEKAAVHGKVAFMRRWRWAAAAAILLLATGVVIWSLRSAQPDPQQPMVQQVKEVDPGQQGAILTLANGTQVLLDTIRNGIVALQGGITAKVVNGELVYEGRGSEVLYNTVSTPKGRQFHITLPDQTEVWLNAGSMIRYPTKFAGNERKVAIAGEVYFEVVKNKQMPFRVDVNNLMRVEVLGTHFNINAYDNEKSIRTTLIEGSVRVKTMAAPKNGNDQQPTENKGENAQKENEVVLDPGEEAGVERSGNGLTGKPQVRKLNANELDKALAWKNGGFDFEEVTLAEAMRQIERWYDVEVVIKPGVPVNAPFDGQISRHMSLNKLIKLFEKSDLKFTIEDNHTLIISK